MFDEQDGMRRSDYIESTGMSEMKVAYDDLNRTAYGLAHGVPVHGTHSSVIGGFSATPEGAAIVSVAASLQLVAVHKSDCFRCGAVDSRIKSRVTRGQLWVAGTAIQGLSRNTQADRRRLHRGPSRRRTGNETIPVRKRGGPYRLHRHGGPFHRGNQEVCRRRNVQLRDAAGVPVDG